MNSVKILISFVLLLVFLLVSLWYFFIIKSNQAPQTFSEQMFVVRQGESVTDITNRLESAGIINSAISTRVLFSFKYDSTQIKAGTYSFDKPMTSKEVVETLIKGQFANDLISVTFYEGENVADFGIRASEAIENFDLETWNTITADYEGELFPDTYHIPQKFSSDELFELLYSEHNLVIDNLYQGASTSLSQTEVVILASILEREANDKDSMKMVSGILQNRLAIDMPLQADATIEYVIDSPLGELPAGVLASHLREIDSPYNTYLNTGLPPTPISNPGKTALEAAINPTTSNFYYYITDDEGVFHYSTNYTEHLINIERYLR